MRGSNKGPEPAGLRDWKAAQRAAGVEPEYADLQHPEKGATVDSLFAEQTGQCVYCGRGISRANQRHHIEHFRPRRYRDLQLDYANLFLSCGPESDDGPRQTCGNHKDGWFDENCHIPPAPESCAHRFRFGTSGEIAGDGSPEAEQMIAVLNLNYPELVAERQFLILDLERELDRGTEMDDLRDSYLQLDDGGARPSFANVAIGYLRI